MDYYKQHQKDLIVYSFFWIFIACLLSVGTYVLLDKVLYLERTISVIVAVVMSLSVSLIAAKVVLLAANQPLHAIWQAVWHLNPGTKNIAAPNLQNMSHGHDLAESVINQIYNLASNSQSVAPAATDTLHAAPSNVVATARTTPSTSVPTNNQSKTLALPELLELIPMPVVGLDAEGSIVSVNGRFASYIGVSVNDIIGKTLNNIAQLSMPGKESIDNWLQTIKNTTITADITWDKVQMLLPGDSNKKQLDIIGHYSQNNPAGYDSLLTFIDHTERYNIEDNQTSYVALAVHELRTPLTVLRGYIEVFDDELGGKLSPELKEFMAKMSASAQTLTAFVSNILNVARVDENQLSLSLHEENWNVLLPEICKALELRAKVRGKSIELDIAPNLPTVAVDKISIYEVVSNLIENAIKYSGEGKRIIIHAKLTTDGLVETSVQDFGMGIPNTAIKHLFTKFYRSHRSRAQVGGTGLGLYLVKAIVTAHDGTVWVQSKEDSGSSFGFTLQPYANLATDKKSNENGIEHHAHGWIKNHSLSRE